MNVLQPTRQAIQPGGPAVGARDVGGRVGGERHRRRDHRQHAVVHDEHVRGHRRDAELDQRRREQRRGEDIDAHRRQADAEHEGEHRDQQQQQEDVVAGQRDELQRHAEGEPGNGEDADHDAGGGADQDDVERDAPGIDHRRDEADQGRALAAIAERQRQHHQHGGRDDRGLLRRQQEDFRIDQREHQEEDRHQEMPARFQHLAERRRIRDPRPRRSSAWRRRDRRG